MVIPAFEHNQQGFAFRTTNVDSVPEPYFEQIFWADLGVCAYLPSTVVAEGLGADGLPDAAQITGPKLGDLSLFRKTSRSTIVFIILRYCSIYCQTAKLYL